MHRTPGLIRQGSPELYRVALTVSGHACLLQGGRAARLGPGVFSYDRRGRGGSGDTQPYAVEREIEDLAAVIAAAGGSAAVFGGSSGAGLALRAAVRNPAITRLALSEPPYHVDDSAPPLPDDFAGQLDRLVSAGRRAEAVECFFLRAAQVSPEDTAAMRGQPFWPAMEAAARPWPTRHTSWPG